MKLIIAVMTRVVCVQWFRQRKASQQKAVPHCLPRHKAIILLADYWERSELRIRWCHADNFYPVLLFPQGVLFHDFLIFRSFPLRQM